MGGLTDMERKGCELIIHDHDCDYGGVDRSPHSDWGDFRRRCAVDISRCLFTGNILMGKCKKDTTSVH